MGTVIKVWGEGRGGLWTPQGNVDIPPGYAEVPSGDHYLTRTIKQLADTCYVRMKHSKKGGYSYAVAVLAPADAVEAARVKAGATERQRQEKRQKAAAYRAEKEKEARLGVKTTLIEMLPGIPEGEANAVVNHAFEVGSGRVGRVSALDLTEKLALAVMAHIRHEHTGYDALLAEGWDRDEAREAVRPDVDALYERWRQPKAQRPRRFTQGELAKVGVTILDERSLRLKCDCFGEAWWPSLRSGGRFPRRYWRCPRGCN